MRQITKIVNLYKFEELNEKQKREVLANLIDINLFDGWWNNVYEDAEQIGLEITGFELDRGKCCKGFIINNDFIGCAKKILAEHGDSCETYPIAQRFIDYVNALDKNDPDFDLLHDDLEEKFLEQLLNAYANILQDEYNYRYSDEAIIDTIEANDYEFTDDGKIF